jgi:predicted lipoprotein with Yx(FWY)xxD motif
MRKARSARMAGLGVLAAFVLAACSGGSGGSSQQPAEQQQPPPQPAYTTTPPAQQQPAQGAAGGFKVANSQYGAILTDAQGRTLYGFANDASGKSTCYQQCASAWPPVVAQSPPQAAQGLNPALLTAAPRQDGTMQVMYGKWPLYYFSGDQQAGQTNGQGSKGVWFVVGASGKLVKVAGGAGGGASGGATQTTGAYGSGGGSGGGYG